MRQQATTGRLRAVLAEYQEHHNAALPHQGIGQRTPDANPDAFHGTTKAQTAVHKPTRTGVARVLSG